MVKIKYLFLILIGFFVFACSEDNKTPISEKTTRLKAEESINNLKEDLNKEDQNLNNIEEAVEEEANPVIVTINGTELYFKTFLDTVSEASKEVEKINRDGSLKETDYEKINFNILDSLIRFELAVQDAFKKNYNPTEFEIDKTIRQIKKDYGGTEEFYASLKENNLTENDLIKTIEKKLAVEKWRETEFLKASLVSDEEAKLFYITNIRQFKHGEQAHMQQLYIDIPLMADNNALKNIERKVQEIKAKISMGASFESLILEYSVDPNLSEHLGDYGWVNRGEDLQEVEEVIFKIELNKISEPIKTISGIHFVKVLQRRPEGFYSFDEKKFLITDILREEKIKKASAEKIEKLFQEGEIIFANKEYEKKYRKFLNSFTSKNDISLEENNK